MIDEQKIEKLAKWMGAVDTGMGLSFPKQSQLNTLIIKHDWNPLTNIADAWMLVERAQESMPPDVFDAFIQAALGDKETLLQYTVSEVALAISDAVLEMIGWG